MRSLTFLTAGLGLSLLTACEPTMPVVKKATPNLIAISYDAFGLTPTLTPEALDMAINHCKKYKLFANYRGATLPNILTTKEVHTFACESVKTDDNEVINSQNKQYNDSISAISVPTNSAFEKYKNPPLQTSCFRIGSHLNCTSH